MTHSHSFARSHEYHSHSSLALLVCLCAFQLFLGRIEQTLLSSIGNDQWSWAIFLCKPVQASCIFLALQGAGWLQPSSQADGGLAERQVFLFECPTGGLLASDSRVGNATPTAIGSDICTIERSITCINQTDPEVPIFTCRSREERDKPRSIQAPSLASHPHSSKLFVWPTGKLEVMRLPSFTLSSTQCLHHLLSRFAVCRLFHCFQCISLLASPWMQSFCFCILFAHFKPPHFGALVWRRLEAWWRVKFWRGFASLWMIHSRVDSVKFS